MNTHHLTSAATLAATLLLATGCAVTPAQSAPQGPTTTIPRTTTPCLVSADRIEDFRRTGQPLRACLHRHQPASSRAPASCLVVADRVQLWIDLRLPLPHCVRALQRAAKPS